MKSSLRKLRGFAFQKNTDVKEKGDHGVPLGQDDLLHASQDMLDMRNCYDSLLSAAAATANSAYEFSEALREMGTFLLDKTSINDDEENGGVLLKLGRVQFELQKLVDNYRAHVIQTITTPSESLLKELHTVEEMKRQCDDKRDLYKYMLAAHKEKGRNRNAKGENFSSQQLQAAREDYEEEANIFVFRLKSLKQGQSRSLLTQAARHHAAQLDFFRKGIKPLEEVEPLVKVVAEQQHIDFNFIGVDDDDSDGKDYSYDSNDYGELSFDYGLHEHRQGVCCTNRNSMEVDQERLTVTTSTTSAVEEALKKNDGDLFSFRGGRSRAGSQSAPILPDKKFETSERIKQMNDLSPKKCHSYVLPMPADAKILPSPSSRNSLAVGMPHNEDDWPNRFSHPSLLEPDKPAKDLKELSSPISSNVLNADPYESNGPIKLPSPSSAEGLSFQRSSSHGGASDSKKFKRQTFSGPLTDNSLSNNSRLLSNEATQSARYPPEPSLMLGLIQSPQLSVPSKLSPSNSSHQMLPSKNNELYELPRPPGTSAKSWRSSSLGGHSGPLVQRSLGPYATSRMLSNTTAQLPTPPPLMARSFSIPSSIVPGTGYNAQQNEISSLTPTLLTLPSNQPSRKDSGAVVPSTKPKGLSD